jgi:cell division septal protein FtsQ
MPNTIHERPSTSHHLDAAAVRRAQMRAVAAGLVDGPRMGRRFHVPAGIPLQPSPRRRTHAQRTRRTMARRRAPVLRRAACAAVLCAQLGLLVALLTAPAFRVHTVDVSGDNLLSRQALLATARVPRSSLFTIDGGAIEARLAQLPWVRSATVTTQLPSTVRIAVTEWQPDVLVRHGTTAAFVASNGATLPFTQSTAAARAGVPLLLDYRTGAQQPLLPGLTGLLASAAHRWPAVYGCSVDAFLLSSGNVLTAWSNTGWQAVFGALDSSDALAVIPEQLAVLAALKGRLDFVHPTFGYVDLENPAAPAIGGKPGDPAALRSAIAGSMLPSSPPPATIAPPVVAAPSPSPTAAPTPRPTPRPVVFSLAPPSPSARG